jgi:hypothetical protein
VWISAHCPAACTVHGPAALRLRSSKRPPVLPLKCRSTCVSYHPAAGQSRPMLT